jgi:hypothetical protein
MSVIIEITVGYISDRENSGYSDDNKQPQPSLERIPSESNETDQQYKKIGLLREGAVPMYSWYLTEPPILAYP